MTDNNSLKLTCYKFQIQFIIIFNVKLSQTKIFKQFLNHNI